MFRTDLLAASKSDISQAQLRELGIVVTQDPARCTHLAAPHIVRTQKFICALAYAPTILSTEFIDQCLAKNKLLPPENFELKDQEGEKRLGVKLTEATARALEHRGHLLQGYAVFCTEGIHGGFETYRSIVETNGGKCLLYRGRAGSTTLSRVGLGEVENPEPDTPEYVYLISGTTHDEARLWPKFRQMAQGTGRIPRIVKTDWMLDLALSQAVRWHDAYQVTETDVSGGD